MEGLSRGGGVGAFQFILLCFRVATADASCSLGKLEVQIASGDCNMQKPSRICTWRLPEATMIESSMINKR